MFEEMQTFDFSDGIGDIGGEEIDLRNLDMTDTLIGSAYCELTSALGEADTNVYEGYHLEDKGISDIELVTFDSALIRDAGVRPYLEDENANKEKDKNLDELINKKLEKENEISINIATANMEFLNSVYGAVEFEMARDEKDDELPWYEQDIPFTEDGYIDEKAMGEDDDFTDADFDEQDDDFGIYLSDNQDNLTSGKQFPFLLM